MARFTFGLWDYLVVAFVLIISSGIGIYYRLTGGKQRTVQEYLLADKNMSITPVAFSLMASFMSAITILGVSSEIYTYGFQFIVINLSHLIFTPVAAYFYLPVFFKLQATSAYEYLELRFGKSARLAASFCYTLQMILYMGVVIYAPALALEAVTGINRLTAILSMGLVCTFYSTIGGMKAVLMTDVFQSILMFLSVFSVIGTSLMEHGSFTNIWEIAKEGNRTDIWNFDPDPTVRHSWFSLLLGGGITYLSLYGVNQTQIQRYLTLKDLKRAQKALWWSWPILLCLGLSTAFSGLAIYSKYARCDPLISGYINSTDQLMPYYVMDTMRNVPGLSGLFVAGIFSASLSTISASLNSMAAVTMEDYYKPLRQYWSKKIATTQRSDIIETKFFALFYGIVCMSMAFLVQHLGGVLSASLTIFGIIGGPLLGLFTLGMFSLTANELGSMMGLFSGLILGFWMGFAPKPRPQSLVSHHCNNSILINNKTLLYDEHSSETEYFWLHRVSYLYNGVFAFLLTILAGYLISYLSRKITKKSLDEEHYNSNLFVPFIARKIPQEKNDGVIFTLVPKNDRSCPESISNNGNEVFVL